MDRYRSVMLTAAASVGVAGCDLTDPKPPAVFVAPAALTIEDGQTTKLKATLRNPKTRSVTWVSSNPAIATVDALGNVTGVMNGSTEVIVKMTPDSSISTTVPISVVGPAVATVSLTPTVAVVYVGLSLRLTAQLRASDGRAIRGRTITWASPDPTIADVSTSGVVRGRAPGGPITLTASSEGRSASTAVRVAHIAELCPVVVPVTVGQRIDGRLALGDCELSIDNSYVDVYELTLAAPATVQIDMASTEVDAFLGLFDANGFFVTEDDNSGGGRDAQIVRQLSAGKYRVWANTLTGATSGAYSLTVSQR